MPLPEIDPTLDRILPFFNDDDTRYMARLDSRMARYRIPSYLWDIAILEESEAAFLSKMKRQNVPRTTPITEGAELITIQPDETVELALLTGEC